MVEYVDIKAEKLFPNLLNIKEALLKGQFNGGFLSNLDMVGLDRWIVVAKPEQNVSVTTFQTISLQGIKT